MNRIVCLVADGFGVGAAPDAAEYGDSGADTLGHIAEVVGGLHLPNLERLGIGNLGHFKGIAHTQNPIGYAGRMAEKSAGKDTTTGHWELAGLVTQTPFTLFPSGFPKALLDAFIKEAEIPGVLGNRPASGTEIIVELGEEHVRTGKPIVYTSGDSVFQIAAHEESFGLERLYKISEVARRLTLPYNVGRVIARPFIGKTKQDFKRTDHRRDYAMSPAKNCLDLLGENGVEVCGVGKIEDIFAHRGLSQSRHTGNNPDSLRATQSFLKEMRSRKAFIFTNLVDFDMLYGHRRDPIGYGKALVELDAFLPNLLQELDENDLLLLTADHGCDPTFRGTDHTREYVPLIAYTPRAKGGSLGDRECFADVAASLLDAFHISRNALSSPGKSFLCAFEN